jgi:hypothetical protein
MGALLFPPAPVKHERWTKPPGGSLAHFLPRRKSKKDDGGSGIAPRPAPAAFLRVMQKMGQAARTPRTGQDAKQ